MIHFIRKIREIREAAGLPRGIDDINFSLNLRVAISGLTDDHPWQTSSLPDLSDLPDEVDHVGPSFPPCPSSLLQVKVDSVTAVLLRPAGHLNCHFLSRLLGGEPRPRIGGEGVGVAADGKHDHRVSRYRALSIAASTCRQFLE